MHAGAQSLCIPNLQSVHMCTLYRAKAHSQLSWGRITRTQGCAATHTVLVKECHFLSLMITSLHRDLVIVKQECYCACVLNSLLPYITVYNDSAYMCMAAQFSYRSVAFLRLFNIFIVIWHFETWYLKSWITNLEFF